MKTNKSLTKRIRVTKSGKLKARKPGFNHFNSRQSRTHQLEGRTSLDITMTAKDKARFLPHHNTRVRKSKAVEVK
jgi:ribosomal protein L35